MRSSLSDRPTKRRGTSQLSLGETILFYLMMGMLLISIAGFLFLAMLGVDSLLCNGPSHKNNGLYLYYVSDKQTGKVYHITEKPHQCRYYLQRYLKIKDGKAVHTAECVKSKVPEVE